MLLSRKLASYVPDIVVPSPGGAGLCFWLNCRLLQRANQVLCPNNRYHRNNPPVLKLFRSGPWGPFWREDMRPWIVLVISALGLSGCHTHQSLRQNTLFTMATLADLNCQQVLDNVARFVAHPDALPSL